MFVCISLDILFVERTNMLLLQDEKEKGSGGKEKERKGNIKQILHFSNLRKHKSNESELRAEWFQIREKIR